MEIFLSSSLLLLIVASVMLTVSKSLGLGSILGLLVAGIIIGPYTPGPYVTTEVETLRHFAEFGIVILLFIIGLEMKPKKLWDMKVQVFGLGGLQVLITGVCIGFYMWQFIPSFAMSLMIGFTFALSSTAFVMQLLQEKGEVASLHGRSSFAILLFQDLAIVPMLAILPMLSANASFDVSNFSVDSVLQTIGSIGFVIVFGKYIAPFAFENAVKHRNAEGFVFIVILSVLLSAYLMNRIGLSMALGAFIMGMLFSTSRYIYQVHASIEPFRNILMSIFFIAVGMSINIAELMKSPWVIIQNIIVIFAIKIMLLFILAIIFKHPLAPAVRMSFLLAQSGEFGFVLLGSAKALNIIDEYIFVLGMGVISLSMLLTPMMYSFGLRLANNISKSEGINFLKNSTDTTSKIVVAGYGDTGKIIGAMLKHLHLDFVAIDNNIQIVKEARKRGEENIFFGNIANDNFLEAIKIEQARVVIITINHGKSAILAIAHIKKMFPHINIIARSLDVKNMNEMFRLGANTIIAEKAESSLQIGSQALLDLGIAKDDIQNLQEAFRKNNYEILNDV